MAGVERRRSLRAGAVPVIEAPVGPPLAPDFTVTWSCGRCRASLSGCRGRRGEGLGAPARPVARVDAAVVTALADAWWVAVMARMDRPVRRRPSGSPWTCPVTPGTSPARGWAGWRRCSTVGASWRPARDSLVESRELWTVDRSAGELEHPDRGRHRVVRSLADDHRVGQRVPDALGPGGGQHRDHADCPEEHGVHDQQEDQRNVSSLFVAGASGRWTKCWGAS